MMRLHGPRQSRAVSRLSPQVDFTRTFQRSPTHPLSHYYHIAMHTFFLKVRMVNVHFFPNSHANMRKDQRPAKVNQKGSFLPFHHNTRLAMV